VEQVQVDQVLLEIVAARVIKAGTHLVEQGGEVFLAGALQGLANGSGCVGLLQGCRKLPGELVGGEVGMTDLGAEHGPIPFPDGSLEVFRR
jgi:hypothetical protein